MSTSKLQSCPSLLPGPCKYVLATDKGCSGPDPYGYGVAEETDAGKFEIIAENIPCDEAVGYSCIKDLQVGRRRLHSVLDNAFEIGFGGCYNATILI